MQGTDGTCGHVVRDREDWVTGYKLGYSSLTLGTWDICINHTKLARYQNKGGHQKVFFLHILPEEAYTSC